MSYKTIFLISSLLFNYIHAQNLTTTATPCTNPAPADDKFNTEFRYGCFCGQNYPGIVHPSKKSYKELNSKESQELIEQYKAIEPYDDIDKVCQEHDICYISHREQAGVCDDLIYASLDDLEKKFTTKENNISHQQCKNLSFDMGSVFGTIFFPSDNDENILELGILFMNSGISMSAKLIQESLDAITSQPPRYPAKGEKCILPTIKDKKLIIQ